MARAVTPKTPNIDWAGLKRRTRQVTRTTSVFNYVPGNDGRTLIFVGTEGAQPPPVGAAEDSAAVARVGRLRSTRSRITANG